MGVQWDIDFDYDAFEKALYDAVLEAFIKVQEDHKNETFYTFSLSSSLTFENAGIYANTEERLVEEAQKHHEKYTEKMNITFEDVKLYLRYQYWHYGVYTFGEYKNILQFATKMLSESGKQKTRMIDNNENFLEEEAVYVSLPPKLVPKLVRMFNEYK